MSSDADAVLKAHVSSAFGGKSTSFSEEFLRELRVNWREALGRSRRSLLQIILLSALFTLLAGANVSEIAFAGVKLTPGAVDLIATAIPAIVAFLFAQYWELTALVDRYEDIHSEMISQLHPSATPVAGALQPPETNHPGMFNLVLLGRSGPGEALMFGTAYGTLITAFFLPFALIIVIYAYLVIDFGFNLIPFFISLAIAAFFVARAIGFWRVG
jgi:hypothetical protein